mmetsp:Transcript_132084/g.196772  ORF Transcript_132084/g.196772 Transcript_132084/m.196772 type:complete len:260 (+) Transcript_132084:33-812(+)
MTHNQRQRQSLKLITRIFHRRSTCSGTNGDTKGSKRKRTQVLGGVYHSTDEYSTIGGLIPILEKEHESFSSLPTIDSTSHEEEDESMGSPWRSSGSPSHHQGAPLLIRSSVSQRHLGDGKLFLSDEEILGRIMLKAHKLPRMNTGYFVSNHIMINNERTKRTRVPLKRNPGLDEIAREHAREMATQRRLTHPDLEILPSTTARFGVNIGRGPNVSDVHKAMMASEPDKNNIIDRRFVSMGVGTAKGSDGAIYLCQLFGD